LSPLFFKSIGQGIRQALECAHLGSADDDDLQAKTQHVA